VAASLSAVRVRLGLVLVAAAFAVLAATTSSWAGTLTSSCNYGAASRPFLPWGDLASYTLVPGGSFEDGAPGWTLAGGARVVSGNESFYAHSALDRSSLSLPAGSSATTAPFCVSLLRPTIRLFVANGGSSTSKLRVRVVFRSLLGGVLGTLDGGTITAGPAWKPSPVMLATLNAPLGTKSAQFVFTPADSTGSWRIDDLYVDPWVNV
jgi:hypothetical protein